MAIRSVARLEVSKKIDSRCPQHYGLKPGDEINYIIEITNGGETREITVCDTLPDILIGADLEETVTILGGETLTFEVPTVIAEGVCEPKSFTNIVEVKDGCDTYRDAAETCVIGNADDLEFCPPYSNDHAGVIASLLGFDEASMACVIDWINCGGSLKDIINGPELPIDEICDLVIAKFDSDELKKVIQACVDAYLTKAKLGAIIQG